MRLLKPAFMLATLLAVTPVALAQKGTYKVVHNHESTTFVISTAIENALRSGTLTLTPKDEENPRDAGMAPDDIDTSALVQVLTDKVVEQEASDNLVSIFSEPSKVLIGDSTIVIKNNKDDVLVSFTVKQCAAYRKAWRFKTTDKKTIVLQKLSRKEFSIDVEALGSLHLIKL